MDGWGGELPGGSRNTYTIRGYRRKANVPRSIVILPSRRSPLRSAAQCVLGLVLLGLVAACDDVGLVAPDARPDHLLPSGTYDYEARDGRGRLAWYGTLRLEVDRDGRIFGSYRLPWQCSDSWGYEADCVGYVGGRVDRGGTVRFGLDEGWLAHEGRVRRDGSATGEWLARLLGYSDRGSWELVRF